MATYFGFLDILKLPSQTSTNAMDIFFAFTKRQIKWENEFWMLDQRGANINEINYC